MRGERTWRHMAKRSMWMTAMLVLFLSHVVMIIHVRWASRRIGRGADGVRRATTNSDEAKLRRVTGDVGDVMLFSCPATAIWTQPSNAFLHKNIVRKTRKRTTQHDCNKFPSHHCSAQHQRTLRADPPQTLIHRPAALTRSEPLLPKRHPRQQTSSAKTHPCPEESPHAHVEQTARTPSTKSHHVGERLYRKDEVDEWKAGHRHGHCWKYANRKSHYTSKVLVSH